jgi:hypothetical protein
VHSIQYYTVCHVKNCKDTNKAIDNAETMLQLIRVQQTYKGFTMSDNVKFVSGILIVLGMVALGFILIASYFDVLVK